MKKTLVAVAALLTITGCVSQSDITDMGEDIKEEILNEVNTTVEVEKDDFNLTDYLLNGDVALAVNGNVIETKAKYSCLSEEDAEKFEPGRVSFDIYLNQNLVDYKVPSVTNGCPGRFIELTSTIVREEADVNTTYGFMPVYNSYPKLHGKGKEFTVVAAVAEVEDPTKVTTVQSADGNGTTSTFIIVDGEIVYVDNNTTTVTETVITN